MFQLLIPFKSAGREDHSALRRDRLALAFMGKFGPGHPAILDQQPAALASQLRFDPAIEARPQKPPDQCLTKPAQIFIGPTLHFGLIDETRSSAKRRFAQHHPLDHAVIKDLVGPVAQLLEAEQIIVERPAAAGLGAGPIEVVIRVAFKDTEPQRIRLLQKRKRSRPFANKSRQHGGIHLAMIERAEIGQRSFVAIGQPGCFHLRIIRNPHYPAGNRRGPAQPIAFVDNCNPGAAVMCGQRGGQARCPRANDQDIGFG